MPPAFILRPFSGDDIDAAAALHHYMWNDYYSAYIPASYASTTYSLPNCRDKYVELADALASHPDAHRAVTVTDAAGVLSGLCYMSKPVPDGCVFDIDSHDIELQRLYLLPSARGHGLGRRLLADFTTWFSGHGYKNAFAWSLDDNPASVFYTKTGALPFKTVPYNYTGVMRSVTAYGWNDFTATFERN